MDLALVKILNPNPRPLLVLNGNSLLERVTERGEVTVVVTAELRIAVARGKSRVVLSGEGAWEGEQWVQEVGPAAVRIHPDDAMKDSGDGT